LTQPETDGPKSAAGAAAGDAASPEPAAAHEAAGATGPGPAADKPATPAPGGGSDKPAGELRLKLFARTDVGQIREHNEDNFLVADLSKRSRGLLEDNRLATVGPFGNLFAVCDGMGGAAAGEVASQLAVDIIYERMVDGLDDKTSISRDDLARRLVRAVETAGFRIFQEAKADRSRRGMGTTTTAAALVDDHLFFAQVGDSRGYILRDGVLTQVTRDQSLVNQLIEAGQLTAEEAETFEHNNIILQALGTSDTVQVDLTFAQVHRGDMMLLCSDGLSGMVRFDEIREIMTTAGEPLDICKALTEQANQAGGHDNITVIIVVFEGESLQGKAPGEPSEPLKYRKYALPEEGSDGRGGDAQELRDSAAMRASEGSGIEPSDEDTASGLGKGPRAHKSGADGWHEAGPHVTPPEVDEGVDLPVTHVPPAVVVAIVIGVITLLAWASFILLR
jgi:PPM family protein phosphatase